MNDGRESARPSAGHAGRSAFNWSIYDAGDRMIEKLADRFRGDLVDLGCGDKPYEPYLRSRCSRYIGLDWGNSMHRRAADVLADLTRPLPIRDAMFDTVITFSVMEHLSEPQAFLAEAARILRPGGSIILQVPFMWQVHEAPYDFFRYTRYGLEHLLARAGFVDIAVEPTTGFWVMYALKLNYQLKRFIVGPGPVKALLRAGLGVVFWLDQHMARGLDRIWPDAAGETAGYFATARKP